MSKFIKYLYILCCVFMVARGVRGDSCGTGYDVASYDVHYDFNVNNPEYPDVITTVTKSVDTNTFIFSDDGNCYSGYDKYTSSFGDIYPLGTPSTLCPDGQYMANGTCTEFSSGGCPSPRYNMAIIDATFVASDDGNCYSGYDKYTRSGDDIYPLVTTSTLCPAGQYMANGTCTAYSGGTCPENMLDTTLNSATWAPMTNGACASNYGAYTMPGIEFACDTYVNHITSDTSACLLMCDDGQIFTGVNSCASLCAEHHKLKTSTGLEFPMYSTRQITPSINIKLGQDVCYVNLAPGDGSNAINLRYNNTTYHTVQ